ncbi:MAG TPA: 50S ribosomal protein L9 [Nitrospiria bacterium]|nr:50S ribosomal protein L9 [Nitrospiria bacterium]
MKVILTEEIKSLGLPGAVVDVSDGYARNFLLPRRKAMPATPGNIKQAERLQRQVQVRLAQEREAAEQLARRLEGLAVTISAQVGEGGKLFGSVTTKDIAAALEPLGVTVEKRLIELEAPIRQAGEFTAVVRLHPSVSAPLRVSVVPEEAPPATPASKKGRRKKSE